MQTAELTGRALDYAVALAGGYSPQARYREGRLHVTWANPRPGTPCPAFSTDWTQAGPIIERERIGTCFYGEADGWTVPGWAAWRTDIDDRQMIAGPSPLVAAMRCYVASKLGDTVEIPEALCKPQS